MNNRLNKYKYPGAKRLMLEAQELRDKTEDYCARPIDDNLFEWHFTLRGPPDTAFEGGFYHGRLSFPTEYPMKPPSIILLTPNGRFETNKKICLSISGYHPETWQPSWSVRTALLALIAFMPTKAYRAIGSLDFSDLERRKLAIKSRNWSCETCGLIRNLLKHPETQKQSLASKECKETCRASSSQNNKVKDLDRNDTLQSAPSDNDKNNVTSDKHDSSLEHNGNITSEQSIDSQELPKDEGTGLDLSDSSDSRKNQIRNMVTIADHDSRQVQQGESAHGQGLENLPDRRRFYPPLVFKSICILLSLLLLRRVVMVLQA